MLDYDLEFFYTSKNELNPHVKTQRFVEGFNNLYLEVLASESFELPVAETDSEKVDCLFEK